MRIVEALVRSTYRAYMAPYVSAYIRVAIYIHLPSNLPSRGRRAGTEWKLFRRGWNEESGVTRVLAETLARRGRICM